MNHTKFFKLFVYLNKQEQKDFYLFIKSPYHNNNEPVVQLYGAILKLYHPEKILDKQKLWKKAFPKKKAFSQNYLNDRLSQLFRLLKEFLIVQQVKSNSSIAKNHLRQALRQMKNDELFKKESLELADSLEFSNWQNHQLAVHIFHDLYSYPTLAEEFKLSIFPQKVNDHLDASYFLLKFQYGLDLLSRQKTYDEKSQNPMLLELLDYLKKYPNDNPIIEVYAQLIELQLHGYVTSKYEEAKQLYLNHFKHFNITQQRGLVRQFYNLASNQHSKGNANMIFQCLEWYQFQIKHNLLLENEALSEKAYINVIVVGASCKNFEFTLHFIDTYTQFLNPKIQEANKQLGLAYLYFNQKKYEEASKLLSYMPSMGKDNAIRFKSLNIRCLYKAFQEDPTFKPLLNSAINAFQKYLLRDQKFSANRKDAYFNFMKIVKMLAEYILTDSPTLFCDLQTKMETESSISLKNWLKDEIEILKSGGLTPPEKN